MNERLLTTGEIARVARVSVATINDRIEKLRLEVARTPGGQRRLTAHQAKAVIEDIHTSRVDPIHLIAGTTENE